MNLEQFKLYLDAANMDANTKQFAINCYVQGRNDLRQELYTSLTKMPLNDTAHSIAVWIREQK